MSEENDPPQPPPPEQPTLLGNLAPDEMFARGMQSVKMTSGAQGTWQPPSVEEANRLFPNYTVLSLLGRGGMGAVYKAKQTALDRLVAIKLLPLEISVDKDFADRFVREARAMARLNHPNIITVHDFGTTSQGHLYFVMEYVEGANLADLIHQVGLDPAQALSIVEQVCTALAYAHNKGIVHRDIKPANVMIDTESQVKVADFGLARLTDPSAEQMGHTMTGTVMGTPDYMAPEQMRGMNVDHRADIYSLGVMVYEMLCREVPRGAFELPSVRGGCDPRIDPIVIKAMQPNPDRRYQSTQEMKSDVVAVRQPAPEVGTQVGTHQVGTEAAEGTSGGRQTGEPHLRGVQAADAASAEGRLGEASLPTPPKKPATPKVPPRPAPAPPETAVMQAIKPPGPKGKSKTSLYTGIAVVILIALLTFLVPKLQLGHAPGLGSSASPSPSEAGASPTSASPSQARPSTDPRDSLPPPQSLGTRDPRSGDIPVAEGERSTTATGMSPLLEKATKDAPFVNTLGMKFVPVPILGRSPNSDLPSPTLVLFSAWDTRVQDYAEFVKETKRDWPKVDFEQGPTHPAVNVSWEDAQLFCQWLTERERTAGRLGGHRRDGGGESRLSGDGRAAVGAGNESTDGAVPSNEQTSWVYRLPSDHEWSCAVGLAGEDAAKLPSEKSQKINDTFPWGTEWPPPKGAGNYAGEELQPALAAGKFSHVKEVIAGYNDGFVNTSPVGSFAANRFGLYDMGGNVRQWCEEWYDKEQKDRVLRGAAWDNHDRYGLLSSFRLHYVPGTRYASYGFRCVLALTSSPPPATSAPERWQDLLPGIKLPDDIRDNTSYPLDQPGHWELGGGSLRLTSGRGSVVVTPVVVGPDYDVEFTLTLSKGAYNASVGLPVGGQKVIWETLHGVGCGFERIGNTDIRNGPASAPDPFVDGKPHRVQLSVRSLADGQASLRSTIDGQPSTEWTGPASELNVHPSLSHQPKDRLCLGASASTTGAAAEVVFSDVRFRPVAGAAVPPPAGPKVP